LGLEAVIEEENESEMGESVKDHHKMNENVSITKQKQL